MLLFAGQLRGTGHARDDLDDRQIADVVCSTNSAEYFLLLAQGLDARAVRRAPR